MENMVTTVLPCISAFFVSLISRWSSFSFVLFKIMVAY